jgi:transposase
MKKSKYPVILTESGREKLLGMVNSGKSSAKIIKRANVLLMLDESEGKSITRAEAAKMLHTSEVTIARVTKQYIEEGMDSVLKPKRSETQHPPRKIDGGVEARLTAIACSTPPEGFSSWTLQMIADKAVELRIIDSICPESVRRALKKRIKSPSE